jgi:hypothetical protein
MEPTQDDSVKPKLSRVSSLGDLKSPASREIWDALAVSKQGALAHLRPPIQAGLVKQIGTQKTGRYILE